MEYAQREATLQLEYTPDYLSFTIRNVQQFWSQIMLSHCWRVIVRRTILAERAVTFSSRYNASAMPEHLFTDTW